MSNSWRVFSSKSVEPSLLQKKSILLDGAPDDFKNVGYELSDESFQRAGIKYEPDGEPDPFLSYVVQDL